MNLAEFSDFIIENKNTYNYKCKQLVKECLCQTLKMHKFLEIMRKSKIVHADIKLGNIVCGSKKAMEDYLSGKIKQVSKVISVRLIDLGAQSNYSKIDAGELNYMLGAFYFCYPPESYLLKLMIQNKDYVIEKYKEYDEHMIEE
mgnify:FL=1